MTGAAILATGAFPRRHGAILMATGLTILAVLVSMAMLPTGVVGAVGGATVAVLSLAMWYSLESVSLVTERSERATDSVIE